MKDVDADTDVSIDWSTYGLHMQPFQPGTNLKFLWLGRAHREACDKLKSGILNNEGLLVLTGDVGTGKTTLTNALLHELGDAVVSSMLSPGIFEPQDVLQVIADSYGIIGPAGSRETFGPRFEQFVRDASARGKRVLLVVDEAQSLSPELLSEIGYLAEIDTDGSTRPNILLVGQNELNAILAEPQNAALSARIKARLAIGPLTEPEVRQYVQHRLKMAGAGRRVFTAGAIHEIAVFAQGIPRLVNVIGDLALMSGYRRRVGSVTAEVVKECAGKLGRPRRRGSRFGKPPEMSAVPRTTTWGAEQAFAPGHSGANANGNTAAEVDAWEPVSREPEAARVPRNTDDTGRADAAAQPEPDTASSREVPLEEAQDTAAPASQVGPVGRPIREAGGAEAAARAGANVNGNHPASGATPVEPQGLAGSAPGAPPEGRSGEAGRAPTLWRAGAVPGNGRRASKPEPSWNENHEIPLRGAEADRVPGAGEEEQEEEERTSPAIRRWSYALALVLLLAGAGYLYYSRHFAAPQVSATAAESGVASRTDSRLDTGVVAPDVQPAPTPERDADAIETERRPVGVSVSQVETSPKNAAVDELRAPTAAVSRPASVGSVVPGAARDAARRTPGPTADAGGASATPRPRAPEAPASDKADAAADPGAIIEWLLSEYPARR